MRQMTYDGAGNLITDDRAGTTTTYTYNKRNRLAPAWARRAGRRAVEAATSGALVWATPTEGSSSWPSAR